MAEPVIFISRFRVKEGKLEDFVNLYHERIPRTEAEKPQTLVQLGFVSPDGTQLTITRLFADAEAFDQQLMGSDERSKAVYELIEPTGIEIYGIPGTNALEMIKRVSGAGIEVNIYPRYIGGFLHLIV
jgi:hypothetical protein